MKKNLNLSVRRDEQLSSCLIGLNVACSRDRVRLLPTLLSHRDVLDQFYRVRKGLDEDVALHVASGRGSISCMRQLVEVFKFDINGRTDSGETPLHFACCNKKSTAVAYLLSRGASANLCDVDGCSALYVAVEAGAYQCVREILKSLSSSSKSKAKLKACLSSVNVRWVIYLNTLF